VLKCLDPDERERLVGITFTHGSRVVSFRLLEETAERCVALREFISLLMAYTQSTREKDIHPTVASPTETR